jgi:NADH-quinone oxidoreductase subunit C
MADDALHSLLESLQARFADALLDSKLERHEVTLEVKADKSHEVCLALRDEFHFEQLMDVCGVDYSLYGVDEWSTGTTGFSRGVAERAVGRSALAVKKAATEPQGRGRFAVVYHLLSVSRNLRLRVRVFAPDDALPLVDSVVDIWPVANWGEREAFDLFGIAFAGHPDLRRILTDYGFIGHPFRKDFPLIGTVEMRYDPERGRVIYEPVNIESRVLEPRVIRHDHRYTLNPQPTGPAKVESH